MQLAHGDGSGHVISRSMAVTVYRCLEAEDVVLVVMCVELQEVGQGADAFALSANIQRRPAKVLW